MWLEDTGNINFKLDKRFRRKIFSLGPFALWESFRIVQYNDMNSPNLLYRRGIGISEKYPVSFGCTALFEKHPGIRGSIVRSTARSAGWRDRVVASGKKNPFQTQG